MNNFLNLKIRNIKIFTNLLISLLTIIFLLLISFENNEYNGRLEYLESQIISNFEEELEIVLYSYRQLSNVYYQNIIDNDRILEIMKDANLQNDEGKNKLRDELISLVEDDYNKAILSNFRQYHFELKDNTSFLRMHKPEKFGDDLSDIRYTVKYVNENEEYIEGFEEGRIFNGYRFQYPLFYKDDYVGTVEVSMSFESIYNMMKNLFNTDCIFLMKKQVVDEKVWQEEAEINYSTVEFSDSYYIDNLTKNDISFNSIKNIIEYEKIDELMEKDLSFNLRSKYNGIDYCNGFLSIRNVENEPVAYLIFSDRCHEIYDLNQSHMYKILLYGFLWLLTVIIIVIIVQNRIKIEKITNLDKLTDAYNRNLLFKNLQNEINLYKKNKQGFSILLLDVDDFKQINDEYGHIIGDQVLKIIVDIIKNVIDKKGSVFRYGGDEFLIILSSCSKKESINIAQKIIDQVNSFNIIENEQIKLSLGLVQYSEKYHNIKEIITEADNNLYQSKKLGKNRYYTKD